MRIYYRGKMDNTGQEKEFERREEMNEKESDRKTNPMIERKKLKDRKKIRNKRNTKQKSKKEKTEREKRTMKTF